MLKNGILALATAASFAALNGAAFAQSNTIMFAVLQGENENPNPTGAEGIHGAASVVFKSATRICFSLIVNGAATPTAAHIHRGFGSENGPVVVDFVPPAAGNPGTRSGCVTTTALISNEIRANRYGFYVNVHTQARPGGALRGQLF